MLGDLDLGEIEGPHRLDQQDHAGDDRGRAVGVQAGDVAALGERHGGQAREQHLGLRAQEPEAVDAGGVVGVELLEDRRAGGGGAGDGDAVA